MLNYTFILQRKINFLCKILYLLFLGTFLAVGALIYNIYQPTNIQEKKIDIPVVNKIKEAKPLIEEDKIVENIKSCLLYTSPSPRDGLLSRMPSSA